MACSNRSLFIFELCAPLLAHFSLINSFFLSLVFLIFSRNLVTSDSELFQVTILIYLLKCAAAIYFISDWSWYFCDTVLKWNNLLLLIKEIKIRCNWFGIIKSKKRFYIIQLLFIYHHSWDSAFKSKRANPKERTLVAKRSTGDKKNSLRQFLLLGLTLT